MNEMGFILIDLFFIFFEEFFLGVFRNLDKIKNWNFKILELCYGCLKFVYLLK